jgi:hypothetical protein
MFEFERLTKRDWVLVALFRRGVSAGRLVALLAGDKYLNPTEMNAKEADPSSISRWNA